MRGRTYKVPVTFTAQTVAIDFVEIIAAATGLVALRRIYIGQSSDAGDAEEEILQVILKRATGAYTSGSGGGTPTPVPNDQEGAAASFSAETRNTTQATAGTGALTSAAPMPWNVRTPFEYIPADDEEINASPTDAIIVSISAPADSLTIGGFVEVEELGT